MEHTQLILKSLKLDMQLIAISLSLLLMQSSNVGSTTLPVIGPVENGENTAATNPTPINSTHTNAAVTEQIQQGQSSQAVQISQAVNSVIQASPSVPINNSSSIPETSQTTQAPLQANQPAAPVQTQQSEPVAQVQQPSTQSSVMQSAPNVMNPPVTPPAEMPGMIRKVGVQFYGSILPNGILIQTSSGIVQLPIATSTNQTIVSGNTFLKSVFDVTQKNGPNVMSNNPVVTLFPAVNRIAGNNSGQSVECYYKSGLLYITYSSEDGAIKNPVQNYADIKSLNELFQNSDVYGQYFVYITAKEQHKQNENNLVPASGPIAVVGYIGQVLAIGTTVVPGDTICVAKYALPQQ